MSSIKSIPFTDVVWALCYAKLTRTTTMKTTAAKKTTSTTTTTMTTTITATPPPPATATSHLALEVAALREMEISEAG